MLLFSALDYGGGGESEVPEWAGWVLGDGVGEAEGHSDHDINIEL